MKIAFVDLGKHFGGAENYLISIMNEWQNRGNKSIVVVKKGSIFSKEIGKRFPNIELIEVDYRLGYFRKLKKILHEKDVDLININGINSGLFCLLAGLKYEKITTVHSNAEMDRADKNICIRKLFVKIENICLKKSNYIISVSEAIRVLLIQRGIDDSKISVVNNGVKNIDYGSLDLEKKFVEPLKLCYVGRLEKVKGCDILLNSLKMCTEFELSCDIFGDGELKDSLVGFVVNNDLNDKVCFKGFVSNVRELLPYYDVMVMPSLYEASPLSVPEAMNSKTLIVCSDVGGLSFMIRNGENGYSFTKNDYVELSRILKNIVKNRDEAINIVNDAYSEFLEKYTENVMYDRTFEIYGLAKQN